MDGSLGPSAQSVKDVCENILKNINIPLCLWDERLSTVGAFNLSSQLDIKVSNLETLLLNVLNAPGVTFDVSSSTYLDDQGVAASFINLDDIKIDNTRLNYIRLD